MNRYFIYNHGGSANHGCEALVRTVSALFGGNHSIPLISEAPQQDIRYDVDKLTELTSAMTPYSKLTPSFWDAYLALKLKGDYVKVDVLPYRKLIRKLSPDQVELSVGGDIYCYEDYAKFILLHRLIAKRGCRSVLLGCSLEEKLFEDPVFVADMQRYTYISARESLTYGMLQRAGIHNIGLTPDSAFTLDRELLPLPKGFIEGNTIGINLSPLVVRKEAENGMVMENFIHLIRFILNHTDYNVALIPHVVWQDNDDRTVLNELYQTISCPDRVVLIDDYNCMQLKGFISRCRFFIGARTHATIAAYSTLVPTLVLGYSVKSRGIATDLFGTDKNYVLSVQELQSADALTKAFQWLMDHEQDIRRQLAAVMPDYVARATRVRENVELALG